MYPTGRLPLPRILSHASQTTSEDGGRPRGGGQKEGRTVRDVGKVTFIRKLDRVHDLLVFREGKCRRELKVLFTIPISQKVVVGSGAKSGTHGVMTG